MPTPNNGMMMGDHAFGAEPRARSDEQISKMDAVLASASEFADTTTLGAVARIYRSTHWLRRTIWVLLFLALLSATLWNVSTVIMDYMTFPVTTSVSIEYQATVPFPTVTVCNRNPVRCTTLVASYVRHPLELGNLMKYSRCKATVPRLPLIIIILIDAKTNPINWKWVQGWNQTLMEILRDPSQYNQLEMSLPGANTCNEAYFQNLTRTIGADESLQFPDADVNILSIYITDLIETCQATGLENIMFPEFSNYYEWDSPAANLFGPELASIFKNKTLSPIHAELVDNFKEFMVDCRYMSKNCTQIEQFVAEFHVSYGICYTFNQVTEEKDLDKAKKSFRTGSWAGLSMELMFNQMDYIPTFVAAGAGGRVAISDPGTLPDPTDAGHYIQPNTETDFALSLSKISRLKAPYTSTCWDAWNESPFKPLFYVNATSSDMKPVLKYTQKECNTACELLAMINKCNCSDPYYMRPFIHSGQVMNDAKVPVCRPNSVNVSECIIAVLTAQESDSALECSCNLPCSENQYTVTTSSSEWPSYVYFEEAAFKYGNVILEITGDRAKTTEEKKSILSREFAKVNIYFETLKVEEVQEEVKYDMSKALGDLGGATGLYLGICIVTFVEILELILSVCGSLLGLKWLQTSPKVEDENVTQRPRNDTTASSYPRYPLTKSAFGNAADFLNSRHF